MTPASVEIVRTSRLKGSEKRKMILQLLADGLQTKQIAAELSTSQETVKNDMMILRNELGADTTAQAVAMGLRRGLIQ
jgi:DNA-binding NarL/FixJ family response regulator